METNNWISVKNRLPKHCETVMIPCDDNPLGMKMAIFLEHSISEERRNNENFFCQANEWGFDDHHIYYGVRAWLPLPKPTKELLPNKNRCIQYLDMTGPETSTENNDMKDKFQVIVGNKIIKQKKWFNIID